MTIGVTTDLCLLVSNNLQINSNVVIKCEAQMNKSDQDILELLEELTALENELPEEYEEWQLEYSYDIAQDFVSQVAEELDDFDFNNSDDKYIPGCSTYALFLALVPKLVEMGYTKENLFNEIEENMGADPNATLH
jgi:hypothetical protein